jgi:hypothetical protein
MITAIKDKPVCPYATKRGGYSAELDDYFYSVMCDLVDKYCLVEYGQTCETYDEFLEISAKEAEEESEEQDG